MYNRLDQYPIDKTIRAISEISGHFESSLGLALEENRHASSPTWPIEFCVNEYIRPFQHLTQDEEYDIFCYAAREYHGSCGDVAAVKGGDSHVADCTGNLIMPKLTLPQTAVDPMEVIFCDGTPEGYLEAVLYSKMLHGLPRSNNIYSDGHSILFHRPENLTDDWDLLVDVSDWCPRVKDSSLYLYMYEYEHGFEASNGRDRITLRQYNFHDHLDWIHLWDKRPKYPVQLPGKDRYHKGKHCCVFHVCSINIAEAPDWRRKG